MTARPLYVLSLIFVASFLGRIAVMASELDGATVSGNSGKHDAIAAEEAATCLTGELADTLATRIERLREQEADIAERHTELERYENKIKQSLTQLKEANAALSSRIEENRTESAARIAKLAAIYEGMKAAEASKIIEQMDPEFAAGLLSSIASEQAAQIVASMDPQKAYLVSVLIANNAESAE